MLINYKEKYYKYKLKYLNLVGGEDFEINLEDYTIYKLFVENEIIKELSKQRYSVENYIKIKEEYQKILKELEIKKSKLISELKLKNLSIELYLKLIELANEITKFKGNLEILSLPPFNKKEKVDKIIKIINTFNFTFKFSELEFFINRFLLLFLELKILINDLLVSIIKDFYNRNEIDVKDSVFYSLNHDKIILDFSNFIVIFTAQFILRLLMLFEEIKKNMNKLELTNKKKVIDNLDKVINEYKRIGINFNEEIDKQKKIKAVKYINKINELLKRCNYTGKTDFEKKIKMININDDLTVLAHSFLAVLYTIRSDLPTNKCIDFYGMDDVSKYDFYDLLKKLSIILIDLNPNSKKEIEQKIDEVKQYLSISSRAKSFLRKLKPTDTTIKPEEQPNAKIIILINEFDELKNNCISVFEKTFIENFNTFKIELDPSNIKKADIQRFDNVWRSVKDLEKDSYKCSVYYKKEKISKKELYEKLKEIGEILLSNISELELKEPSVS